MSLLNHSLGDGSNFDAALRPLPRPILTTTVLHAGGMTQPPWMSPQSIWSGPKPSQMLQHQQVHDQGKTSHPGCCGKEVSMDSVFGVLGGDLVEGPRGKSLMTPLSGPQRVRCQLSQFLGSKEERSHAVRMNPEWASFRQVIRASEWLR